VDETTRTDETLQEIPASETQQANIADLFDLLRHPLDIRSLALSGLFILALLYTLYFARAVFLPIVLALLFSFLLRSVVSGLRKFYIPDALGAALVLVAMGGIVGVGFYQLSDPAAAWVAHMPQDLRHIERKLHSVKQSVEKVSKATEQLENLTTIDQNKQQPVVTVESKRTGLADIFLNTTVGLLTSATVMFILLYFLLASGDLFLLKLVRVLPSLADKKIAVTIVRQIQEDISHYLSTITIINIGLGITVGLAMFCLGMPNAVLWGVMAGALNFIPYLGALVSTVVLTFVALLSFEDLGRVMVVPLVFVGLTSFEGLVITPTTVGRRLTLNPVVIFVWLTFWGWMWGIAGTLLAVPLLATLKILCDYIKPLAPIGEFLSR